MSPAILGSPPAFPDGLRFAQPLTPPLEAVMARVAPSYERGQLTNGALVHELEERIADRVGVTHAVAVSSCTAGLMLTLQALRPTGGVVLPSFTFAASAHAVAWNHVAPIFAECHPHSFQLDAADAEARLDGAGAVLATHVFGAPCEVDTLAALARRRGVPLLFDAAHALGARRQDRAVGAFGDAEVFSLSPTKLVVAGEGGVVTTSRDDIAAAVRVARDYGNPGDYDMRVIGLNARMSELHAATALESLALLDDHLALRQAAARRYLDGLSAVPGLRGQAVDDADLTTFKDLTVIVDPSELGLDREQVVQALDAEGISTRRYFSPPIHRQQAYAYLRPVDLPTTDDVASRVLSLPMFGRISNAEVDGVVSVLSDLHAHAEQIRASAH